MKRVVVYFSQDLYSRTRFVVSTTSSGSQVVKNFHLCLLYKPLKKLFKAHNVMNATCEK